MVLRGFTGHFRSIAAFRARPVDALFALGVLAALTAILYMEHLGRTHA